MEFSLSRSSFREIGESLSRLLSISSLLCLFLFGEGFEHELLELHCSTRLDIRVSNGMAMVVGKLRRMLLERRCSYFKISKRACHGFSQLKNHRLRRTRPTAMTPQTQSAATGCNEFFPPHLLHRNRKQNCRPIKKRHKSDAVEISPVFQNRQASNSVRLWTAPKVGAPLTTYSTALGSLDWRDHPTPCQTRLTLILKDHLRTKNKQAHQFRRVVNSTNHTQKHSPGKLFLLRLDLNTNLIRCSWLPLLFLLKEPPLVLCGHYWSTLSA